MNNACRTICGLAVALSLVSVTAYGRAPSSDDVRKFLAGDLPSIPCTIDSVLIQAREQQPDTYEVSFKATLRLDQPLFLAVDAEAVLAKAGWNATAFSRLLAEASALPGENLQRLLAANQETVIAPVVLEQTASAGDKKKWHGSVIAEFREKKWTFSEYMTEERGRFIGTVRENFGGKIYLAGKPETMAALESARKAREAVAGEIRSALRRGAEQPSPKPGARQVPGLRIVREETAAAPKRLLPVQLSLRPAEFGAGRAILQLRNVSGEFLVFNMLIADGVGRRRVQMSLSPGQLQELGWLQGWIFKSGDRVEISGRSFDVMRVRVS